MEKATEFTDIWDIILLVDEDIILISPELPFVEGWYNRMNFEGQEEKDVDFNELLPDVLALPDGLVWFILLISISIPRPQPFDASSTLMQLVQGEWMKNDSHYRRVTGVWGALFE